MKWIESRGQQMPIIGQPTVMECWITCYQMLLNASGLQWNLSKIEQKLMAGGFTGANNARITGIGGEELLKCAEALGLGYNKTSVLTSLATTKMMMQLHGPLWVAGHFKGSTGSRYKHVVMAIGVEEELNTVAIVNPWKQNLYDTPTIGWMSWKDFSNAIAGTLSLEASLQYLNPMRAFKMKLDDKIVVKTATFHRTNVFAK